VRGLRERTDYPAFDVVIVDNGSVARDAVALLNDLRSLPNFKVIRCPGPFNYALLCNAGAEATDAPVLIFLNNDIAMLEPSWLQPLVRLALRADVGAVGAKLVFPDGRIQHAGVVLGLGNTAGHPYRGSPGTERGYLGELQVAREVASVTGACLAVERAKFQTVGGFDAVNLPVEFNDVDLCLRLAERGWGTVWTPECVLIHKQSRSRGFQVRPHTVYRQERQYFTRRWAHVFRDDPYFHPALSLFSHTHALA
jgi:GT2 family glycosyltransferase